jgi:hypothetical protein
VSHLYQTTADPLTTKVLAFRMHLFLPISKVAGRLYACPTARSWCLYGWKGRTKDRLLLLFLARRTSCCLLESFNFGFLRRTANSVAQEYAHYAWELVIYADWFNFFPVFLSHRLTASRLIVRTWL